MSEKIDWSNAPEDATHCWAQAQDFFKLDNGSWMVWYGHEMRWAKSIIAERWGGLVERPSTPSWSGEGLPPVGTACEVRQKTPHSCAFDWEKCTIGLTNIGANGCVQVCTIDHRGDFAIYYPEIDIVEFRPIRTHEQIAADEREAAIDQMVADTQAAHGWTEAFGMLHDKGYRKP